VVSNQGTQEEGGYKLHKRCLHTPQKFKENGYFATVKELITKRKSYQWALKSVPVATPIEKKT
jgi:hypothetical protein